MATKVVATATVRALKGRKLIPTRAALTLVSVWLAATQMKQIFFLSVCQSADGMDVITKSYGEIK